MSLSALPLSYCTNVHPGLSRAAIEQGWDDFTVPIRERSGAPLAAGLWLASPVIRELTETADGIIRFGAALAERGLTCHTLNAFPYGDFHDARVKEHVYLPDWTRQERLDYTIGCAQVLAGLLPEGGEGSISTVPLGFEGFVRSVDFTDRCIAQLLELARRLDRLHAETGRLIRLAIEPEPLCVLETTHEAIEFFHELWRQSETAGVLESVRRHVGLCYDVCHQAVEFEDVPRSIARLAEAGVRINKLHITCALELTHPAENDAGREALARYVEPRYLHQTLVHAQDGAILRMVDLDEAFVRNPPEAYLQANTWRIHFHVPVNQETLGPLGTTRTQLKQAIGAVAALDYAPHLEVETYTWEVLPGPPGDASTRIIEGIANELIATRNLLASSSDVRSSAG